MMRLYSILIIISAILIYSLAPAGAQVEETLINWSYPHYQDNLLIWKMNGKTAMVREDKIILSGLELIYYLQPVSPTSPAEMDKKSRVLISSDMGTFKKQQQVISLHENITIKKISDPPGEFDETLQTTLLYINLADRIFSTDALITVSRNDISIKSKGCKGGLDFANVSFLGNVETVIQGCNSKSISLGAVFSPKPNIDDEELNKTPSVITITSGGPMNIEKINGNPTGKTSQQISFRNKVALNSYSRQANSPPRQTNLRAENLDILLDRRENPVTRRNNFYLANVSAANNVRMDDTFHAAACSGLTVDESAGIITLKGDDKSLAAITRPLKPDSGQPQAKADSYINISAQTIKIQTEKDKLLLLGRKEITFANGSIYNPEQVSPTDTASPTVIAPPEIATQIQITADNDGLISLRENQIHLENNVRISQKAKTIAGSTGPELKTAITCGKLFIGWNPSKNLLEKIRAENNVVIETTDGGRAWCELLEWAPLLSQINLKSPRKVIIFDKNSKIEGDEIVITTTAGYIGDWMKIEIKNKTNGSIRISPKEKEEPKEEEKPK